MKLSLKIIFILTLSISLNFNLDANLFVLNTINQNNSNSFNSKLKNSLPDNIVFSDRNTKDFYNKFDPNKIDVVKIGDGSGITVNLTSSLGTKINYCSIVSFRLYWSLSPDQNSTAVLHYLNYIYYPVGNRNYLDFQIGDPYNGKEFTGVFDLYLNIDSINKILEQSISIQFNPSSCINSQYPILNTNDSKISYTLQDIPYLSRGNLYEYM